MYFKISFYCATTFLVLTVAYHHAIISVNWRQKQPISRTSCLQQRHSVRGWFDSWCRYQNISYTTCLSRTYCRYVRV